MAKAKTKTKTKTNVKSDHLPLTQFRSRLASSGVTLKELKEGSGLCGFSDLPINDIRLVIELMAGLDIVPARREKKPSRAECLDYISKFTVREADHEPSLSTDEPRDSISYPSSDDSE
jgi:hypothetical protein